MTASAKYRCQSVAAPDLWPQIPLSAGFAKNTQTTDILRVSTMIGRFSHLESGFSLPTAEFSSGGSR
jgi:hypothetical protein